VLRLQTFKTPSKEDKMKRAHGNRIWRGVVLTAAISAVAVLAVAGLAAARGHHRGEDHRHGQDTGTIAAFDNSTGELTIALSGSGDTFSGLVTRRTKIRCEDQSGLPANSLRARENEPGDDHGGRGSGSGSSGPGSGSDSGRGEEEPGDDHGVHGIEPGDDNGGAVEPGDDNGAHGVEPGDDHGGRHHDDNGVGANCTAADLVVGATVHEAELDLRNGKAVWDEVELNG
jgi:hypothetical protein